MIDDGRYLPPRENGYKYIQTRAYRIWKRIRKSGEPIAPEWAEFDQFFADLGPCPDGFFIQKTDPSLPWDKTNTAWVSHSDYRRPVIDRKDPLSMAQKARDIGMKYHTFYMRTRRGWTVDEAYATPAAPPYPRK